MQVLLGYNFKTDTRVPGILTGTLVPGTFTKQVIFTSTH